MTYGRLAQLVEHLLDVQEVTGSSPVPSTTKILRLLSEDFLFMAGRIGREQQRQGITIAWYPAFCARLACSFTREYGILNSTNRDLEVLHLW